LYSGGAYRFADLRAGGAVGLAEAPWFLNWGSKIDPNPKAPKVDLERMFRILPLVDMLKKAGGTASGWRFRAATSRTSTVISTPAVATTMRRAR